MRHILPIVIRLAVATALGWFIGMLFGDRYDPWALGEARTEVSAVIHQAAAFRGAVVGLVIGALSATPWIGARARGVAFFRGAVAGAAACWLGSRVAGGFSYKLTLALLAFGLVGGVLGAIGSRRSLAPAARRTAAGESLGTIGMRALKGAGIGLVAGLLLAFAVVGTDPRDLGVLLYAYAPIMLGILGIVIGVLVPSTRAPVSRRAAKTRSRSVAL